MIDWVTGFFTGGAGIVLVVLGLVISIVGNKIIKRIDGTALEAELGELLKTFGEAIEDKKITAKEGRKIGKAGKDSLVALKEFLGKKD